MGNGKNLRGIIGTTMNSDEKYPEGQMQRNVTDYINDSIDRLKEWCSLLELIKTKREELPKHKKVFNSLIDVYSRDMINVLSNVLDQNKQTSSLFTLLSYIETNKESTNYRKKIDKIKLEVNDYIITRGAHTGHFNTKHNSYPNDRLPLNTPISVNQEFMTGIVNRIEDLFWKMKEEAKIDGVFVSTHNWTMRDAFSDFISSL